MSPHHEICRHYGALYLVTQFNIVCLFRDYLVIVTPVSVLNIQDLCGVEERERGGLIDSFAGS